MNTKEVDEVVNEQTYTRDEAIKAATEYFGGDEMAADVWVNKYALKDSDGNLYEYHPDQMHKRLAKELAKIESNYPNSLSEDEIYNSIKGFKYIVPQGSPMAGIGNNKQLLSLSNCFVIHNDDDSYGGILRMDQELVQLQKRRAGVGLDLSHLRPSKSSVNNAAITSTGAASFMERFSNSTREVAQDGRRGALMETISIRHPDAEQFIDMKMEKGKVTGANISVKVPDDFIEAVKNGENFIQKYPVDSEEPEITQEVDAQRLFKKIVHNNWQSAEPGFLYWDQVTRESIPDEYSDLGFKTVSTNPCGEITLCGDDSCRLTAMNLFSFVQNPFTDDAYFDFELFYNEVYKAQKIMDDIIDIELQKVNDIIDKIDADPEDEETKKVERNLWERIKRKCEQGRRTGLGVTAMGDTLAALGHTYGTDEANKMANMIHKNLKHAAYESSADMAKDRGAFPIQDVEREEGNVFLNRIKEENEELYKKLKENGRRNIALLTVAPTGSVSIMTQTTSGLEPAFLLSYKRRRKINPNDEDSRVDFTDDIGDKWQEYHVFHHKFLDYLKFQGYNVDEVMNEYSKEEVDKIVENSPYHNATSNDVDWVKKVEMQGMVQDHVDHSISVTVNLPNDISKEMVEKVYMKGYETGCKGMTIYRDGSRSGVLISDEEKQEKKKEEALKDTHAPKRPKRLKADVIRFQNNKEKWIAVVGLYNDRPYEIFTGKQEGALDIPTSIEEGEVVKIKENGHSRYDFQYTDKDGYKMTVEGLSRTFNPEYWNYAKLISGVLRHGMPLQYVYDMVESLNLEDHLFTWKKGVARVVKKYIPEGTKYGKCPQGEKYEDCGLIFKEGCLSCEKCGKSECS